VAVLAGCATNAVTGRRMLMLVSEGEEINQDRTAAPHQFSADYGALQDTALNDYVAGVGRRVAAVSHRPQMPYSFRGVNAVYVNAYTFPAGSVAVTRGMLLDLQNEAELGAVLGHEVGHVNARHTGQAMTWGVLAQAAVVGASLYLGQKKAEYGALAAGLGGLGSGLLLARYSRDNEREADALGLGYMVKAGYGPQGMVGLMELLKRLSTRKSGAAQTLFATHPMSDERYQTAVAQVDSQYAASRGLPLNREAYLDRTAGLRAQRGAIEALQKGEAALVAGKANEADAHIKTALQQMPDDYCGLLLAAKCSLAQGRAAEAQRYVKAAEQTNPGEAQAHHVGGMAALGAKQFDAAYQEFNAYEQRLPGNPNTVFFKGYSLDGMNQRDAAATTYARYLRAGGGGDLADHARTRLAAWGYLK
jgi:predicted Zn-dependent protease